MVCNDDLSFYRARGSGLGFTICIIDLQPIGSSNRIIKYADDCSLMVPEKCDADMLDKFQHLLSQIN